MKNHSIYLKQILCYNSYSHYFLLEKEDIMNVLKADTFEKVRLKNGHLFADMVNAIIFGGRSVISPSSLHDCDSNESTYLHLFGIDRTRDVIKKYNHESYMIMIGIENQSTIDETMPFRVMGYDFINYINQNKNYERRKKIILEHNKENPEDRKKQPVFQLYPVTTIVLNYGEARWNKARSLKEMMHVIPEHLQDYINDWKINVINIRDMDYSLLKMKDNRDLVEGIQRLYNSHGEMDSIKKMDINYETALDLFAVTRSTKMLEVVKGMRKEDFHMCTAVNIFEEKMKKVGYESGKNDTCQQFVTNMYNSGMSIQEMMKITQLSEDDITLYLHHTF